MRRRRDGSPRRGAAGPARSVPCMRARISGGAVSGEPALNGGAGLYSSRSWIASAVCRSTRIDTSVSAKSIPAVTPPPVTRLRSTQTRVLVRRRAERRKKVHRRPVRGRAVTSEQAGRAQHQRSRADRGDVFGARRLPAQEFQHLLVIDHVVGAGAAGHADHVELRAIRKADGRRQRQHGVARDRLDPFPDQMHLRARHARKHLQRPGEIELGHLWKHEKSDLKRCGQFEASSLFSRHCEA